MANRLAAETSPYLRQHADNPVDWYPWGDEAFAAARRRDRPVLLSVGYSACHWCHVMAHESFEDPDVAGLMNELFVNVKVDREERPDVDAVYMDAVQAMTGRGGWPMTVFLTPDGRPFFGGTYFPRSNRGGMTSFPELLGRIDELWRTRRADLEEQADELTAAVARSSAITPDGRGPGAGATAAAVSAIADRFDPDWGGFGRAPKFPQAMTIDLLWRAHVRTGDPEARQMATRCLDAMAAGGIYDHLGGGFARYSTDERWLVPHFEKMLYDQALLARAYLHAWLVTGEARHAQVLRETVDYVLADLRAEGGGFMSAEDADSEGVEGRYYVWSRAELVAVAGEEAADWYGATDSGNWEGTNILFRPIGAIERPPAIEEARRTLLAHRRARVRPGLDDKVLTEWNALFLATLAEAAAALDDPRWLAAAEADGEFLCDNLRRPDGRWLRSWQAEGGARHLAYAADHAALVDAFTRLAEATGRARWIAEATATADALLELFWDDEAGGVFTTGVDADRLVTRPKDVLDNATPSANSLAALALLRLAALTGETRYEERAQDILRLVGRRAADHPTAFAHLLAAADLADAGATEIAIPGDEPELRRVVLGAFRPSAVLAWGEPYPSPLWEGRSPGAAYVCRDFTCELPAHHPDELAARLA